MGELIHRSTELSTAPGLSYVASCIWVGRRPSLIYFRPRPNDSTPKFQKLRGGVDHPVGSWDYYSTTDNHTLATMWSGAQTTPFTAENAATIDRVTEIGIACPGLAHGSYGSGGSSSGATLARFQVTGSPGTNMVYRPTTPLKIDASHLIGARLQDVNVALVDQHGVGLSSLLGEKYSELPAVDLRCRQISRFRAVDTSRRQATRSY